MVTKGGNITTKNTKIVCIVAIIAAIVLLSGCVSSDNAKSTTIPQTADTSSPTVAATTKLIATPKPTATPKAVNTPSAITSSAPKELLIIPSDIPGFSLKHFEFFTAEKQYENSIPPAGMKIFGQMSVWDDGATQRVQMMAVKGAENALDFIAVPRYLEACERHNQDTSESAKAMLWECGSANIGDQSYYSTMPSERNPDVWTTELFYKSGENYVTLKTTNKKGMSQSEAFRLANSVLTRLKQ